MSIPLNTDNWSGKIKSSKAPANTDVWSGVSGFIENQNEILLRPKIVSDEFLEELKEEKYTSQKPVSKFLGLKDGLGGIFTLLPYGLIGVGYGIYTGKTVGSKTRRGLFFGFLAIVTMPILANVGDSIHQYYSKKADKKKEMDRAIEREKMFLERSLRNNKNKL